jgi:dihydroxy-acid dehydratase
MSNRWPLQWRVSAPLIAPTNLRTTTLSHSTSMLTTQPTPSSHGFVVGHVVPEAQVGGPIGLVKDGDIISIDAVANTINVDVSDAEMEKRRKVWRAPPLKSTKGTLYKYVKVVEDASLGCVTDA